MCNWNDSNQLINVQCNQIFIFVFLNQNICFGFLKEMRRAIAVGCLTRDRGIVGSSLTGGTVLCP